MQKGGGFYESTDNCDRTDHSDPVYMGGQKVLPVALFGRLLALRHFVPFGKKGRNASMGRAIQKGSSEKQGIGIVKRSWFRGLFFVKTESYN